VASGFAVGQSAGHGMETRPGLVAKNRKVPQDKPAGFKIQHPHPQPFVPAEPCRREPGQDVEIPQSCPAAYAKSRSSNISIATIKIMTMKQNK